MLALTARALYTPLSRIERPLVVIEGGTILRLGTQTESDLPIQAKIVDFGDCILAPGFMDIHIHGAAGFDLMQADRTGLEKIEKFLAAHGVTSYCPTTVTAPLETTLRALERLADAIESLEDSSIARAQPVGIHLEGPFLSHLRRGVHPPKDLLAPAMSTFDRFWEAARGHISLLTIAPELEGAIELIAEVRKRGICVSLGHSDADLDQTRAAIAAGARHATHTFNAMRPLDHRSPGILGEVLSNRLLTADLIADGIHVHPAVVRLFLEAKGAEKAVLITDALAAAGMPDGRYRLGEMEIDVKEGKCLHQGTLAGSVLTLDRAVGNIMEFAQWTLERSLPTATLNPARVVGIESKGTVQPGADADLVALSAKGEVRSTIAKGIIVQ
jgi:N-acetylglucosamine-6-phosphate deacetylase